MKGKFILESTLLIELRLQAHMFSFFQKININTQDYCFVPKTAGWFTRKCQFDATKMFKCKNLSILTNFCRKFVWFSVSSLGWLWGACTSMVCGSRVLLHSIPAQDGALRDSSPPSPRQGTPEAAWGFLTDRGSQLLPLI